MIVSGGLDSAERARTAYRESGADAVMIARGSFGYPWIFEELTGRRTAAPDRDEVVAELLWVIDAAEEHLGSERASHYLRKFYPWYLARIGVAHGEAAQFQRLEDLDDARARRSRARRRPPRRGLNGPAGRPETGRLRRLGPAEGRCYSSAPPCPISGPLRGLQIGRF